MTKLAIILTAAITYVGPQHHRHITHCHTHPDACHVQYDTRGSIQYNRRPVDALYTGRVYVRHLHNPQCTYDPRNFAWKDC